MVGTGNEWGTSGPIRARCTDSGVAAWAPSTAHNTKSFGFDGKILCIRASRVQNLLHSSFTDSQSKSFTFKVHTFKLFYIRASHVQILLHLTITRLKSFASVPHPKYFASDCLTSKIFCISSYTRRCLRPEIPTA